MSLSCSHTCHGSFCSLFCFNFVYLHCLICKFKFAYCFTKDFLRNLSTTQVPAHRTKLLFEKLHLSTETEKLHCLTKRVFLYRLKSCFKSWKLKKESNIKGHQKQQVPFNLQPYEPLLNPLYLGQKQDVLSRDQELHAKQQFQDKKKLASGFQNFVRGTKFLRTSSRKSKNANRKAS